uniref:Glutathione S-transferase theta-4-like isoform X2 n=1 Tax=Phascolarctos cinereus TaxID=38626 RepID=A0A6P5JTV2_PHACI|nr:glutathione S-transferase theta-4-like isoform X2 [Phascolarctos cinereus]
MSLELYLDLISPPCRAVYIFAKMNNIHFDYFAVDLLHGEQHSKEFEAINILRKVPLLREGSFILAESVPILLYLTRKFSTSLYWYPPDIRIQARIDEYMAWQYEGMQIIMEKILWSKLLIPMITGQEVPQEKVDDVLKQAETNIQLFCDHFLKDKPFLVGNVISLADLMAAVELMQTQAQRMASAGRGNCGSQTLPGGP